MPFSRSRSIESSTRVATSWPSLNAPDCQSMASTSVVLPWSTCATIATLRMSSRVDIGLDTELPHFGFGRKDRVYGPAANGRPTPSGDVGRFGLDSLVAGQ